MKFLRYFLIVVSGCAVLFCLYGVLNRSPYQDDGYALTIIGFLCIFNFIYLLDTKIPEIFNFRIFKLLKLWIETKEAELQKRLDSTK